MNTYTLLVAPIALVFAGVVGVNLQHAGKLGRRNPLVPVACLGAIALSLVGMIVQIQLGVFLKVNELLSFMEAVIAQRPEPRPLASFLADTTLMTYTCLYTLSALIWAYLFVHAFRDWIVAELAPSERAASS
jgi:hypothetical protein